MSTPEERLQVPPSGHGRSGPPPRTAEKGVYVYYARTVEQLHPQFVAWVNAPERTPAERERYFDRLQDMMNGTYGEWPRPIVLGPTRQTHDGKHRLLAAYAHSLNGTPVNIKIFWGRRTGCPMACH